MGDEKLQVTINDEAREVSPGTTLAALVEQLALAPERLALEHNRRVVPRAEWPRVALSEGDRVEIVHFVGGGRAEPVSQNIKKD